MSVGFLEMRTMISRLGMALALMCALFFASPAMAECKQDSSAEKTADIRKLLDIMGSKEMSRQVFFQVIDAFKGSMPQVPAKFWTELEKEDMNGLLDLIVPIYDCHLSHDDITATITFYESPAGQNFVKVLPVITQEAMTAGQKWGEQLGMKVLGKLRDSGY